MGVEGKKKYVAPPLPAPTETESTFTALPSDLGTDLGTDVSRPGDDKSSYSIPEDGTPVTIRPGHRTSKSQTSLLIEYFEGGKGSATGSSEQRKPSVRVRLTPSSKHKSRSGSDRDRIEITQTKSRKASLSRRSAPNSAITGRSEGESLSVLSGDFEDASSYASATEESNVSRNPIDIEIDRSGNMRRRRPASPLIPAADSSSKTSYMLPAGSEISAIPTDSFLDGSGPTTSFGMSESKSGRSRSPSRGGDYLAGAATGLAAAAVADRLRNKSRGEIRGKDRVVVSKTRDKEKDRHHKTSKSRTSSLSKEDKYSERAKSPRRKSSKGHSESLISGADSSVLSSALTPSHRSVDQHSIRSTTSKASSINNPKLLETVEDAIRRLILPELNALKREASKHKDRRGSTSSATTVSRDDYASDRRRSSGTEKNTITPRDSVKTRERRDREARNDFDDSPSQSAISHESIEDTHHIDDTPMRSTDRLKAAAVGAGLGAAALAAHEALKSPSDDKRSRRRRRAEMRRGTSEQTPEPEEAESEYLAPGPPIPLPLMSDINPSELTRTSILSADSDRPHSATEELTPGRDLDRSMLSPESSPTPTRATATLQALGAQHANISHGDLKALPRQRTSIGDYESDDYSNKAPTNDQDYDDEEYHEPGPEYGQPGAYDYYSTQDVPPPLKYVPYQPERRGLSPIPSVSGYTEGGSEAPNRDSRITQHTSDSVSSADRSPRVDRSLRSPSSIPSNIMGREFADDDRSLRSSGVDQGVIMSAPDSELDRVTSGQAVRAVAMNPDFVHPVGIESNVASLVDGSMLDGSVLTAESSAVGHQAYNGRESMATLEEERSRTHDTPTKRSVGSHHEYLNERGATPASASHQSREYEEYDVDEYGRKVPQSNYRQSPTASEEAITSAAVRSAAAVLRAQHGNQQTVQDDTAIFTPAGVTRNLSFKERSKNVPQPGVETDRSVDRLSDHHDKPKLGFNSLPDPNDPLPDLDNWQEDDMITNPSLLDGQAGDRNEQGHWAGGTTPRQRAQQHADDDIHYEQLDDGHATPDNRQKSGGHGLGIAGGAAVAAPGAAAIMASPHQHSRQPSQEQEEEWYRTSDDRKRDTLVTNPYEGTSPIANLPGINDNLLPPRGFDNPEYGAGYATRSPLGHKVDEGYASQGPNKSPDMQNTKGKGVDFDLQPHVGGGAVEDPFYTPKHTRHLSGMSHGLDSPLYDAATGGGIDQIESKDIIALMQHLMVRDAQRSARDTEILVTLVRSATEMRNNFEDIKKMLADTEDVIITEVKDNTEKTVQRAINGPRPYPGSGARSLQAPSQAGTDDVNAKKRSIFRRALKGLGAKGANDLGRIEDMLNQLLTEVDVLKAQTAPETVHGNNQDEQLYSHIQPEIQYEQDRGYEPEGNAGTSTASHASQSGHLSVQSRGASTKPSYDRRASANRISTVPEDNEDEYDDLDNADESIHYSKADMLMTPAQEQRGSSVPLATPPEALAQTQTHTSASNENTPRTAEGKKKSGTRSSWFPKISRWSETTTSSVAQVFRRSGQSHRNDEEGERPLSHSDDRKFHSAPSRSRSGSLASYSDNFQFSDPHKVQSDKLHTGFSEQNLSYDLHEDDPDALSQEDLYPPPPITAPGYVSMTPEDPKYKAHRNSLNLQHPQPRQGQTERFKVALESQAMGFDSPTSPKSADWAGSTSSLNRFPRQANRDSYGSAADQYQQHWTSSPAAPNLTATSGPPRPPKEPMDHSSSPGPNRGTTPQNKRLSKLQKQSPLPHHSVESGYGTMTHGVPTASYISHSRDSGSPRLENRNLSGALGVSRRPSGPRPMTPKSVGSAASDDGREMSDPKRKRDTFGTVTSQDTDTF